MKLGKQVGFGTGHIVLWGPSSPSPKGAQPPIFGPYLLRPNGWMDQDATWHREVGLVPSNIVDGDPAPLPIKGAEKGAEPPIFGPCLLPNGWMDQDATWHGGIGIGLDHSVLDGDPAPPPLWRSQGDHGVQSPLAIIQKTKMKKNEKSALL